MKKLIRDGVALAFEDTSGGKSVLVLVHGWGCDHRTLSRQQAFFADTHRVINLGLRGHGESSSPEQLYSVDRFADDLAWLCGELNVQRATVVGHSMGGAVAVEAASRYPKLVRAAVLIDTVFHAPPELQELLAPLLPNLQSEHYETAYRLIMEALSLATDLTEVRPLLRSLPKAPQHVSLSSLQQHLEVHDLAKAAASCSVPVAYIGATRPVANVGSLKLLIPHIALGQTLGSRHFAPWLVHEQVNAMLTRFFESSVGANTCLA